jgi:hypothetical protein
MKKILEKLRGTYFIIFFGLVGIATIPLSLKPSSVSAHVYDASTKAPMKGVYVLAEYRRAGSVGLSHSASTCVDTKGMYTGPDGKFEFPVVEGMVPIIYVISLDYFDDISKRPIAKKFEFFGYRYVLSKDFAMSRRKIGADFDAAYVLCEQPRNPDASRANIEYLKMYKLARKKYAPQKNSDVVDHAEKSLQDEALRLKER